MTEHFTKPQSSGSKVHLLGQTGLLFVVWTRLMFLFLLSCAGCPRQPERNRKSSPGESDTNATPVLERSLPQLDQAPRSPRDRFVDYIARKILLGRDAALAEACVVEEKQLDIGDIHFFSCERSGGPLRAAVTEDGLVTQGLKPESDWFGLLGAAPASELADRIAWIETYYFPEINRPDKPCGYRAKESHWRSITPEDRPESDRNDPAHWALVRPLKMTASQDRREFEGWFYVGDGLTDSGQLIRLHIVASRDSAATIEKYEGKGLLPEDDVPLTRAIRLLETQKDAPKQDKMWALDTVREAESKQSLLPVLKALFALMADDDRDVRLNAIWTIGSFASKKWAPDAARTKEIIDALLLAHSRESLEFNRHFVVHAIARFEPGLAVEALGRLAKKEPAADVRLEIAHTLSNIRTPSARALLKRMAKADKDERVRELAAIYAERPL